MGTIDITGVPLSEIEIIRPLWEKLRLHHLRRAQDFSGYYETFTFERRIHKFLDEGIDINIEVARDGGIVIGYCISTIDRCGRGEVDSLFIEEKYRREGIGTDFMRRAIDWIDGQGATEIAIVVAAGNEEALPFYRRYGFSPAYTTLKLKNE